MAQEFSWFPSYGDYSNCNRTMNFSNTATDFVSASPFMLADGDARSEDGAAAPGSTGTAGRWHAGLPPSYRDSCQVRAQSMALALANHKYTDCSMGWDAAMLSHQSMESRYLSYSVSCNAQTPLSTPRPNLIGHGVDCNTGLPHPGLKSPYMNAGMTCNNPPVPFPSMKATSYSGVTSGPSAMSLGRPEFLSHTVNCANRMTHQTSNMRYSNMGPCGNQCTTSGYLGGMTNCSASISLPQSDSGGNSNNSNNNSNNNNNNNNNNNSEEKSNLGLNASKSSLTNANLMSSMCATNMNAQLNSSHMDLLSSTTSSVNSVTNSTSHVNSVRPLPTTCSDSLCSLTSADQQTGSIMHVDSKNQQQGSALITPTTTNSNCNMSMDVLKVNGLQAATRVRSKNKEPVMPTLHPETSTIKKEVPITPVKIKQESDEASNSESDDDTFQCGRCKAVFVRLNDFHEHKKTKCQKKKRRKTSTKDQPPVLQKSGQSDSESKFVIGNAWSGGSNCETSTSPQKQTKLLENNSKKSTFSAKQTDNAVDNNHRSNMSNTSLPLPNLNGSTCPKSNSTTQLSLVNNMSPLTNKMCPNLNKQANIPSTNPSPVSNLVNNSPLSSITSASPITTVPPMPNPSPMSNLPIASPMSNLTNTSPASALPNPSPMSSNHNSGVSNSSPMAASICSNNNNYPSNPPSTLSNHQSPLPVNQPASLANNMSGGSTNLSPISNQGSLSSIQSPLSNNSLPNNPSPMQQMVHNQSLSNSKQSSANSANNNSNNSLNTSHCSMGNNERGNNLHTNTQHGKQANVLSPSANCQVHNNRNTMLMANSCHQQVWNRTSTSTVNNSSGISRMLGSSNSQKHSVNNQANINRGCGHHAGSRLLLPNNNNNNNNNRGGTNKNVSTNSSRQSSTTSPSASMGPPATSSYNESTDAMIVQPMDLGSPNEVIPSQDIMGPGMGSVNNSSSHNNQDQETDSLMEFYLPIVEAFVGFDDGSGPTGTTGGPTPNITLPGTVFEKNHPNLVNHLQARKQQEHAAVMAGMKATNHFSTGLHAPISQHAHHHPPLPIPPQTVGLGGWSTTNTSKRKQSKQSGKAKRTRRSYKCGKCPPCLVQEDCGKCDYCLDRPKFGGRNTLRQRCRLRQCAVLGKGKGKGKGYIGPPIVIENKLKEQQREETSQLEVTKGKKSNDLEEDDELDEEDAVSMNSNQPMATPTTALPDGGEFQVEKIIAKRIKRGKVEYLLKWKDYPDQPVLSGPTSTSQKI